MSAEWDVLALGAVTVDDILYVARHPQPDAKAPVLARRREGGGLAGTALVAAARQGAKAAYCGVLGDDDLSRFALQEFERDGVDCSPVLRRDGARPIHSVVIVDQSTGQRSILYSLEGFSTPAPEELDESVVARCRVLFVDHTALPGAAHAARVARSGGIPVVADIERGGPGIADLLPLVNHLVVGIRFAGEATGERDPAAMARALAGPDRACAVVTAGERGCWVSERGAEARRFPAFHVPVVDTTGCGDVFHGAYAAAIARGDGIASAVRTASAAAAIKAMHPGGRSGIPTRATVERFLAEREK